MFKYAIVRKPGSNFAEGITTFSGKEPDFATMVLQHQAYVRTLQKLGLEVTVLQADLRFPDGYFVEDPALVFAEGGVMTRPGAASREHEGKSLEPVLARFRQLSHIAAPGTLDGGDVMQVEKTFFVGVSNRTNWDGIEQLMHIVGRFGYACHAVKVPVGLHLKSSMTYVGGNTLLGSPQFLNQPAFASYQKIEIDPAETYAANTILVNDHLLMPSGYPRTKARLAQLGMPIIELDMSEVEKMDGGLTCLSLRF